MCHTLSAYGYKLILLGGTVRQNAVEILDVSECYSVVGWKPPETVPVARVDSEAITEEAIHLRSVVSKLSIAAQDQTPPEASPSEPPVLKPCPNKELDEFLRQNCTSDLKRRYQLEQKPPTCRISVTGGNPSIVYQGHIDRGSTCTVSQV
jgi:hypothetical protein